MRETGSAPLRDPVATLASLGLLTNASKACNRFSRRTPKMLKRHTSPVRGFFVFSVGQLGLMVVRRLKAILCGFSAIST